MATMQEVWGFGRIEAATVSTDDRNIPALFSKGMADAAKSRGIAPDVESDALDQSRDLMVDEIAHSLGMEWMIVHTPGELSTIRLWPIGVVINWESAS